MRVQFVSLRYSETPHEWDLYVFFLTSLLDTHFDVPREFYPLRSTSSTHFQHLNLRWPLGKNWAKEKTHRSAEYGTHVFFFFACSWFVVNGASGGDPGTTLTALRRQKQTIGYKTVCCSSAARWNGGGSFPPLINTKIQVIFWYYLNLRTLFLTCTL